MMNVDSDDNLGDYGKPLWSLIFTTRAVFMSITNLEDNLTFQIVHFFMMIMALVMVMMMAFIAMVCRINPNRQNPIR